MGICVFFIILAGSSDYCNVYTHINYLSATNGFVHVLPQLPNVLLHIFNKYTLLWMHWPLRKADY